MAHEIRVLDGFNRLKGSAAKMDGANAKLFNRMGTGVNAGTKAIDRRGKKQSTNKVTKTRPIKSGEIRDAKQIRGVKNRRKQPRRQLQGFNRIMQGYARGTQEDLEDWEFLVNIEHPVTLNGFENWLDQSSQAMNGKRRDERRKRRAARKAQRQEKNAPAISYALNCARLPKTITLFPKRLSGSSIPS